MMMLINSHRPCPTCGMPIARKSFDDTVKLCVIGCKNRVCGHCSANGMCTSCFVNTQSGKEIESYFEDKGVKT